MEKDYKISFTNTFDLGKQWYGKNPVYSLIIPAVVSELDVVKNEEGAEDIAALFVPTVITLKNRYVLSTNLVPAYVVDAFTRLKFYDRVLIESDSMAYVASEIEIEAEWQFDEKAFALVRVIFTPKEMYQKLIPTGVVDPIQVLVDQYLEAATTSGYNNLGDEDLIYAKYEELVLANKLTGKSYIVSTDYAYKTSGANILSMLSLTKDNGVYNEVISGTNSPQLEGGLAVLSRVGLTLQRSFFMDVNYNQDSFYLEIEGEIFFNTAIVYWFTTVVTNNSARLMLNTSNRVFVQTLSQAGIVVQANSNNNYFLTGSHIYRFEYARTGNTVIIRIYQDGVLFYTATRTWDGILNLQYLLTSNSLITFKAKRIELAKL